MFSFFPQLFSLQELQTHIWTSLPQIKTGNGHLSRRIIIEALVNKTIDEIAKENCEMIVEK